MTYLKTTSIALALSAVLGASAAYAGDKAPTFADLDANADGQVNITEFTAAPGMDAYTTSEITAKFNAISEGTDTFNEAQYEITLDSSGESTVLTPENPSDVMGAVETEDDYDAEIGVETESDLELDSEVATPDESYAPDMTEPDVITPDSDINPDTTLDTDADLDTGIDTTVDTEEDPEL
ncbi:hypothetical protein [Litorimonas sp.]|uniref:hypothetical protein n=1 Tax=Litorimonas sp. TaxID=1892381 RepID=UPI003A86629D